MAAYADDVLFYIINPETPLPNLLHALVMYCSLCNYRVNVNKSEGLNVTLPPQIVAAIRAAFSLKWEQTSFKHLEIQYIYQIYQRTCPNCLCSTISRLSRILAAEFWGKDHFSWFGRNSVLKMNLLSRLLYLFYAVLLLLPPSFLQWLRSLYHFCGLTSEHG